MALLIDMDEREQIQKRFKRKKPQNLAKDSIWEAQGWERGS